MSPERRRSGASPAREAAFSLLRYGRARPGDDRQPGLSEADSSLATELAQGILRRRAIIDHDLKRFVHLASLDPATRDLLRLGLYQLRFLTRVPDYAAVDETVGLARRHGANHRLVNAVLRRAAGRPQPELPQEGLELLTVTLSMPPWLARRWVRSYGQARAEDYARAALEHPPLHLAANTAGMAGVALAERLRSEGVDVGEHPYGPHLLRVLAGNPLRSASFADGLFYVMGESSYAVSEIAASVGAAPLLDCCASPGGKLIQLRLGGLEVFGTDVSYQKLDLVRQNLRRMRIRGVHLVVADFRQKPPFGRSFPTILLDAPCSGLGVVAKLPEIKWRVRPADIQRLATQQALLLENAFSLLSRAGHLVYSVCSLEPEEGEKVVNAFLARHREAELARAGQEAFLADSGGFYRFFPRPGMQDGFFAAVLKRTR
ncbi:MAG: transcription antitermination factor NusB [Acidobacteriota bacterium]